MRSMAVAAVLLGACSFATVKGPPSTITGDTVLECTAGRGAMAVDVVFTLLHLGIGGAIIASDPTDNPLGGLGAAILLAPSATLALVHGLSASYGHDEASACERAVQELERIRIANLADTDGPN
jgi:hypothetical protein